MQNQGGNNIRGTIVFAELETDGRRIECRRCHVPFNPHLGHLIAAKFQCQSCKACLSYRNSSGRTVRCPCCNFSRPKPNRFFSLVCGGCHVTVIYQNDDRTVKCSLCKHITNPPEANNRIPPQLNRVVSPQVNRVVSPQVNRVVPPGVNRVVPPGVNRRNRTAAETESSASSSFTLKPESTDTIVDGYPVSVARFVRNVAFGIETFDREVEEDKTESESKKICL